MRRSLSPPEVVLNFLLTLIPNLGSRSGARSKEKTKARHGTVNLPADIDTFH